MEASSVIINLIPALLAGALLAIKYGAHKNISLKTALAPLALYALPLLLAGAMFVVILGLMLKVFAKIPGVKYILGAHAAIGALTIGGLVAWIRKLAKELRK